MLSRYRSSLIPGITLILVVIFVVNVLWNEPWVSSDGVAIHIVIENRTNKPIGPFVIADDQDVAPIQVNQIQPFSVASIYYKKSESWGENAITMKDSNGNVYQVVPYFENQQKGRIDIRVDCESPQGLSGRKRDLVSWYFSFAWYSWGTADCY